jgi:CHAD domain-containing protein
MTTEREVKVPVSSTFRVPDLAGVLPGTSIVALEGKSLDATYYDSRDVRLSRWGASLRFRTGEGWTVKLPSSGDELLEREEVSVPGAEGVVPAAALDLLTAFLRSAEVRPVARLHTERAMARIVDTSGTVLAEVVDDEVVAGTDAGSETSFREIEIEVGPQTPTGLLAATVTRLRWHGAGAPDPRPKVVRAIGPAAEAPADVVVPSLPKDPTAAEVVHRALATSVERLILHDPAARLDEDVEGVHQARVATRRLRSDVRSFGPLLDLDQLTVVRSELRWLGGLLGAARDVDVLLDRLRGRVSEVGLADRAGAASAVEFLERQDERRHAELMDGLRSDRYVGLLDSLIAVANDPPFAPDAEGPAYEILPTLLDAPWASLRKAVKRTAKDRSDEALHAVRIRAKRVRYAAEAVAPVLGPDVDELAAAAAELQTVLGEHQDAVVAETWLRTWTVEDGTRDAAFAAGILAGMERRAADAARRSWPRAWKRLRAARRRASS